jgi:hypothetical protein
MNEREIKGVCVCIEQFLRPRNIYGSMVKEETLHIELKQQRPETNIPGGNSNERFLQMKNVKVAVLIHMQIYRST